MNRFAPGCCCNECQIVVQVNSCPPLSGQYARYGNLFPDYMNIPSTGIGIYVAQCTGYQFISGGHSCILCDSPGSGITPTWYPLENPSESGRHVFDIPSSNLNVLVVEGNDYVDSSITSLQYPDPFLSHECLPLCTGTIQLTLRPKHFVGGHDCWWPNLYESGVSVKLTYTPSYDKAVRDSVNGIEPWCVNNASVGGGSENGLTTDISCCTPANLCAVLRGPGFGIPYGEKPGEGTVAYLVNNASVEFNISSNSAYFGVPISELKLLWASVTYKPQGSFPCGGTYFNFCDLFADDGSYKRNYASVAWQYAVAFVAPPTCTAELFSIHEAAAGTAVNLPRDSCGQFDFCADFANFCGENAFGEAENWVQSLPQTIQWVDSGQLFVDTPIEVFGTL